MERKGALRRNGKLQPRFAAPKRRFYQGGARRIYRWPTRWRRATVPALPMKSAKSLTIALTVAALAVPILRGAPPKKAPADAKKADPAPAAAAPAAPAAPAAKPATPEGAIPDTVAVVEGSPIKKSEIESRFAMMLSSRGIPADQVPEEQRGKAYQMILNDLIVDKLLDKRAADEKVTDEEVAATFDKFKQNFGSEEEMAKQVIAHGQTLDEVKKDIRTSLRQQHWVEAQIKGKDEVTDKDADDFYQKNPQKFQKPEQVRASHILVSVPQDAKPEVVTEKQKQAQAIADRVKKGEDFSKLAEQLSEDPSAKENKGDLSYFSKDQMVPEFANAAWAMKKDEISNPVRSQFGFHIIKVVDHKAPETVALADAKPQIMAELKQHKQQEEVDKLIHSIRDKADVKVNLPGAESSSPAEAETSKDTKARK